MNEHSYHGISHILIILVLKMSRDVVLRQRYLCNNNLDNNISSLELG